MTNNPTIDGVLVPRELIDRILNRTRWHGDPLKEELRALLDAPAVERQEPDQDVARYRLKASLPGLDGRLINRPEVVIAEAYDALQSRIDQLEAEATYATATYQAARARIEELESGHGAPVAWANGEQLKLCAASPREVQPNNPMMHNLPRNIAGSALKTDYCNTPLFAAPPSPVAVNSENLARACDLLHAWKCLYGDMRWSDASTFASTEEFLSGLDATDALNEDKP